MVREQEGNQEERVHNLNKKQPRISLPISLHAQVFIDPSGNCSRLSIPEPLMEPGSKILICAFSCSLARKIHTGLMISKLVQPHHLESLVLLWVSSSTNECICEQWLPGSLIVFHCKDILCQLVHMNSFPMGFIMTMSRTSCTGSKLAFPKDRAQPTFCIPRTRSSLPIVPENDTHSLLGSSSEKTTFNADLCVLPAQESMEVS